MLRGKMLAVMDEVNTEVVEREKLVQFIAIALLTRNNLFILGGTGQAKSYAINQFRSRITGARQFERLMSKQCDEEQLFGRLDLGSLIPGGVPEAVLREDVTYQALCEALQAARQEYENNPIEDTLRHLSASADEVEQYRKSLSVLNQNQPSIITTGKIPDCEIVFLDEIFKSNDGILNALLMALNERRYTNEGRTVDIPVISFFAASNEIPNFSDPAESILRPLYDRFQLKVVTDYVQDREKRLELLAKMQAVRGGTTPAAFVAQVTVSPAINELMDDVLCDLRHKNIHVSDRKYFNFYPIVQAKAWLDGLPIQEVTLGEQISFCCTCCGNCCRHVKNAVMLDGYDLYQLAQHFHQPLIEVANRYATSMPLDETGYPIFLLNTVDSDDACVFLKNNRCTVQNAKPRTCRLYPFTAGPGETKEKLRFYLCLEKSPHFKGGTIQVGDWLRKCFSGEDHRFLTAEYDYIPQIAQLVHLLTGERQRLALTQILFFRYFNFKPNRPFMPQYAEDNRELPRSLTKLVIKEGRGEIT